MCGLGEKIPMLSSLNRKNLPTKMVFNLILAEVREHVTHEEDIFWMARPKVQGA